MELMDEKTIDYDSLGRRIRQWRKIKNVTQEELANGIEKTVQHISNIERCHTKVSLATLVDIANYLDVSADALLCDSLNDSGKAYQEEYSYLLKDCDEQQYKKINKAVKVLLDAMDQ